MPCQKCHGPYTSNKRCSTAVPLHYTTDPMPVPFIWESILVTEKALQVKPIPRRSPCAYLPQNLPSPAVPIPPLPPLPLSALCPSSPNFPSTHTPPHPCLPLLPLVGPSAPPPPPPPYSPSSALPLVNPSPSFSAPFHTVPHCTWPPPLLPSRSSISLPSLLLHVCAPHSSFPLSFH